MIRSQADPMAQPMITRSVPRIEFGGERRFVARFGARTVGLLGLIAVLSLSADPSRAETPAVSTTDLPHYVIERAATSITIDGVLDPAEPWSTATRIDSFQFPWWTSGTRETTTTRLLWDEEYLYVAFVATDAHISAHLTERDAPVSRDDAVEVFFACDPADVSVYFNFEFNALGTILDRSPRDNRSSKWNGAGVKVGITIDGTLNDSTDTDRSWTTEIAIPFTDLAPFAPRLPPANGDQWRLNLYRIGGEVNPQFSLWSDTQTERPQYHVPARFGLVRFSTRLAGSTTTSP
ncbi:MAG: carbohydrate-binding family 9-like protein [Gemmatimonadetes bacterium]|jgi:hypothetical protein|nr:carbohydrate-binding family 9-like protein [Gemmatimonadota bacterium]MBT7860637.1 carbohydrate-binding family 9-like protein [Gemmatimonadota bacterium]